MNTENIPMAVILWLCAAVMLGVGCYAKSRREPMHFWSGTTVPAEKIHDVPAYNRACARMWWIYGGAWLVTGAAALTGSARWAGALCAVVGVGGTAALMFAYGRIYRKYERKIGE